MRRQTNTAERNGVISDFAYRRARRPASEESLRFPSADHRHHKSDRQKYRDDWRSEANGDESGRSSFLRGIQIGKQTDQMDFFGAFGFQTGNDQGAAQFFGCVHGCGAITAALDGR